MCVAQGCMQRTGWLEEERNIAVGNRYREKEKARNIDMSLVKELSSETRGLESFVAVGKKESVWWKGQCCMVEFGGL